MDNLSIFDVISFLSSIASLILAIVAILAAKSSEKEVRDNFEKTQRVMMEYQERTKEVLAEIDKKAEVIERTVSESQRQLMNTMTNIINETVIPKKVDMGEQLGMQFMQQMFSNPEKANEMMGGLAQMMKIAEMQKDKK
ncbi:hypothetical protein [Rheinheimera sp. 1928-s]|uniref:hypothetical protein n=1 Tax=Rheinheimera sp. 1928-s TaxID=3033803 RepID=UPI002620B868|nr:hypothetical protein [Rheinheimera sp. 1928-s]MDF3124735.1 hypothetical protein [Rheinheimera sp. 1928-s]